MQWGKVEPNGSAATRGVEQNDRLEVFWKQMEANGNGHPVVFRAVFIAESSTNLPVCCFHQARPYSASRVLKSAHQKRKQIEMMEPTEWKSYGSLPNMEDAQ